MTETPQHTGAARYGVGGLVEEPADGILCFYDRAAAAEGLSLAL